MVNARVVNKKLKAPIREEIEGTVGIMGTTG